MVVCGDTGGMMLGGLVGCFLGFFPNTQESFSETHQSVTLYRAVVALSVSRQSGSEQK